MDQAARLSWASLYSVAVLRRVVLAFLYLCLEVVDQDLVEAGEDLTQPFLVVDVTGLKLPES